MGDIRYETWTRPLKLEIFRVLKKRARFSSIYRPHSPSGRRPTILNLFGNDESPGSFDQYPTAVQDAQARKVSLVENIDEALPPKRHAVIG